jgi:hypothetical protein
VQLRSSTIFSNQATVVGNGGGFHNNGAANVGNSIIAGNSSSFQGQDVNGTFSSAGYNLVGKTNNSDGWGVLGDQVGTVISPINPLLGALQNNGGVTLTMLPQNGSPAIDQGFTDGGGFDQRGRYRPFEDFGVPNATSGDGSDIGAVEVALPHSTVVTNNNDTGAGSLRYIVGDAQSGETVTFSNVVGAITLTSGQILVRTTLNIMGTGAKVLAVNGNNASRAFTFNGSITGLVAGLTISNGNAGLSGGGGILNQATLTVSNCAILGNTAARVGGGIANDGTLTVCNSTIARNQAIGGGETSGAGGGLNNCCGGPAVLLNTTIASNSVSFGSPIGGGIYNGTSLFMTNCTVVGNDSASDDGGISNTGSGPPQATIAGCIIASNTIAGSNPDVSGAFTSGGYNLVSRTNGSSGIVSGTKQDQVGSIASPLDPLLRPLADNGGPTVTMAPRSDSPAIDKGKSFGLATDQRGAPRSFDLGWIADATGGDASDIGAFELGSPLLTISHVAKTTAVVYWPTFYGDSTLQFATNIAATVFWHDVLTPPVVVGTSFFVTNTIVTNRFFRLKNP